MKSSAKHFGLAFGP